VRGGSRDRRLRFRGRVVVVVVAVLVVRECQARVGMFPSLFQREPVGVPGPSPSSLPGPELGATSGALGLSPDALLPFMQQALPAEEEPLPSAAWCVPVQVVGIDCHVHPTLVGDDHVIKCPVYVVFTARLCGMRGCAGTAPCLLTAMAAPDPSHPKIPCVLAVTRGPGPSGVPCP
jgi:hypothetical protein